jgi:CATRA-Associated Small Protein
VCSAFVDLLADTGLPGESWTNSQQRPAGQEAVTPEDVADALSVLRAASRWELAPARWTEVRRAATEVTIALAADDGRGLRAVISAIEVLGPVRRVAQSLALPASGEVLDELTSLVDVLTELESAGEFRQPQAIPVSIYLGDGTRHEQVESALRTR